MLVDPMREFHGGTHDKSFLSDNWVHENVSEECNY